MWQKKAASNLEDLEIDLLLDGVQRYYGYDFRAYDPLAVRKRIREAMLAEGLSTISRFQEKVLHEPGFMRLFLRDFSTSKLSMFSEAAFYQVFRAKIVPLLKTYPFIRIWHLGCSTGEETYSLAILLQEEGLAQRSRIYATDLSEETVTQARKGSFPRSSADNYAANYLRSGGKRAFTDYYQESGGRLIVDPSLKQLIVFSAHNPATDASFNEFQAVICRGVLPGFSHSLRARVDGLIFDSLTRFGVLALSPMESVDALPHVRCYTELTDEGARFYQKTDCQLVPETSIRGR